MTLTKEQILSSSHTDLKPVRVDVGGSWGEVYIRKFNGYQRGEWDRYNMADGVTDETGRLLNPELWRAKLVQLSLVDENNKLLFNAGEEHSLLGVDGGILEELFVASTKINKLNKWEIKAALTDFFLTNKTNSTGSV